jgi:hypothetical protein
MKTLISNYTFDPLNNIIRFNDFYSASNPTGEVLKLESILVITNVTTNTMIYNFAALNKGGNIINGNELFTDMSLASFSNTDKIQIWYENTLTPASDQVAQALFEVARKLDFLTAVRGVSADLRVSPLSTPNMSTLSNLTTLSNLAGLSGWGTQTMVKDFDNLTAINSNINNVA